MHYRTEIMSSNDVLLPLPGPLQGDFTYMRSEYMHFVTTLHQLSSIVKATFPVPAPVRWECRRNMGDPQMAHADIILENQREFLKDEKYRIKQ